ncbi:MAG: hypothetical protein H5T78_02420 [Nocardia sp.]|nr:hypothetical protein [Nocardia sp.]
MALHRDLAESRNQFIGSENVPSVGRYANQDRVGMPSMTLPAHMPLRPFAVEHIQMCSGLRQ